MLSDSIREARLAVREHTHGGVVLSGEDAAALELKLRAWEVEARNLETTLHQHEQDIRVHFALHRQRRAFGRRWAGAL